MIPITPGGDLDFEDLRPLAERVEHYGVSGLSIAVIEDYRLVWAKGYGLLEAGGDTPVMPDSLFHAGSIAKPVPAAAALVLVEQGLLDLDQDVNDTLASWQVPENMYTTQEKVTLRRWLSHSSGLTDGFPMRSSGDPEYDWGRASEGQGPSVTIQQLLEAEPTVDGGSPTRVTRVPRTAYQYSNLGYGVVQLLVTDVTHQSFSDLMSEIVLEPVGMTDSTFEQPLPEALRARAIAARASTGRGTKAVYHKKGIDPGEYHEHHCQRFRQRRRERAAPRL